MDAAVRMAPAVGIVALCAALGLSRATFYRRSKAARSPAPPPRSTGTSLPDELSGRSPVAVCGQGTQGATAPPPPSVQVPDVDAARTPSDPVAPQDVVAALPVAAPHASTARPNKTSPRALSDPERALVIATLDEERFCNLAPAEVYATLLDEGRYLCSERTMYRILDEQSQLRERRNQLRHPCYLAPELMAQKPNQLWS